MNVHEMYLNDEIMQQKDWGREGVHAFLTLLTCLKINFSKKSFTNTRSIRVWTQSVDSQNVGPDLGPNYLQRISADTASRQRVNHFYTGNL